MHGILFLLKHQKPSLFSPQTFAKKKETVKVLSIRHLNEDNISRTWGEIDWGVYKWNIYIYITYIYANQRTSNIIQYHYLIPNWTFGSKHVYMNQTQTRPFGKLSKRLRSWTTSIYPFNKTYSEEFAITNSLTKSWRYKELGPCCKPVIDNLWPKIGSSPPK